MYLFNNPQVEQIITLALNEDIGTGDITTLSTIPADKTALGRFVAKEDIILCGIDLAAHIFARVDPSIELKANFKDGDAVKKGDVIATVSGNAQNVLTGERTALNFMQRLTGIATRTHASVAEVAGTNAKITDTRKTTPGLRVLEKYAVRVGRTQGIRAWSCLPSGSHPARRCRQPRRRHTAPKWLCVRVNRF